MYNSLIKPVIDVAQSSLFSSVQNIHSENNIIHVA